MLPNQNNPNNRFFLLLRKYSKIFWDNYELPVVAVATVNGRNPIIQSKDIPMLKESGHALLVNFGNLQPGKCNEQ